MHKGAGIWTWTDHTHHPVLVHLFIFSTNVGGPVLKGSLLYQLLASAHNQSSGKY